MDIQVQEAQKVSNKINPKRTAPGHILIKGWWWFSCWVVSDSCDRVDWRLPGSSTHGILHTRILEWVGISSSRGSSQPRNGTQVCYIVGRFSTDWATGEAQLKDESESEGHSFMSDSLQPHDLYSPWNSAGQSTRVGTFSSPGDLPNPGIEPRSPTLQADSFPVEPQGKPKNTGVGSLSLFQRIFLTQELNQGLLYGRQILYQLSYLGSPIKG